MSFQSFLDVAGRKYNVLRISYALHQETDATGRPSSISRGGKIEVTVESTQDTSLFEWMSNSFERRDGYAVFFKRDAQATLKELRFAEGYLVKYRENFSSTGKNPLTETITISARSISMGSGGHSNEWM